MAQNAKDYRETHKEELRAYHAAYGAAYHAAHREEQNEKHRSYNSSHREELKRLNAIRYAENPEYEKSRRKEYYKNNPDVFKDASRRRRARKNGAPINDLTTQEWESIKQHYNFRCVYCLETCKMCKNKKHKFTQDHIIPLSKGGSHTVSNVVPACSTCNRKKYTNPPPVPVQPLLFAVPKTPGELRE